MSEYSGYARSFGREPKPIYRIVNDNLALKIADHLNNIFKYSGEVFQYYGGQYIAHQINKTQPSSLSTLVTETFYNIIGSLDMIAISLIFIHNNQLSNKNPNELESSLFTIENIYPYFMSYYELRKQKDRKAFLDLNSDDGVSKFTNFSISFIENVINCLIVSI